MQRLALRAPKLVGRYLREGAPSVGLVPWSGLFEAKVHLPTKTPGEVLQASKWAKHVLRAKARPSVQDGADDQALERTEDEVKEGKAEGPSTEEEEVDGILGRVWAPVRRSGRPPD